MPKWKFEQLAGEKLVMELDGYAAPFGRPRQKPLMREVIEVRVQTTKYPGGKGTPTRHVFGSGWEDMELEGRWMSRHLEGKKAGQMADEWTQFVRDEQPVRMSWGNIVSYDGLIGRLELAREGEDDIAWKLKLLVDRRADEIEFWVAQQPTNVIDNVASMIQTMLAFNPSLAPGLNLPDMSPNFLEQLDFFAGQLSQYSTEFNKLANQLSDLEKAAFSTIQHFRGAITGFQTALLTMRETVLNAETDSVLTVRNAESDIAWLTYMEGFDVTSTNTLWLLADLERQMEILTKGEVSKLVTAKEGDTWERISDRATGGPDKAGSIREANGIRFGTAPIPGEAYLVP